jgi:hypothetical protein
VISRPLRGAGQRDRLPAVLPDGGDHPAEPPCRIVRCSSQYT